LKERNAMEKKPMLYAQRTLDFETPANTEAAHVAEQTSEPPPADQARQAPPLVRPDRQVTYDGIPIADWPEPLYDESVLVIKRLRPDIDGPPHYFLIKTGDRVEVVLDREDARVGTVADFSQ